MIRRFGSMAAVGVTLLALAACGHSSKSATATPTTGYPAAPGQTTAAAPGTAPTTGAPAPGSSVAPAGSGEAIKVSTTSLGPVVVDATTGRTLYRYDNDTNKPPASNCTGACLTAWPAVPYVSGLTVTGISRSLIGSVKRPDGSAQLTIGGFPMYLFSRDTAAGDTHGQAVGKVWWAVTPTGGRAGVKAPTSTPSKIGTY